jgi:hypothetical protein
MKDILPSPSSSKEGLIDAIGKLNGAKEIVPYAQSHHFCLGDTPGASDLFEDDEGDLFRRFSEIDFPRNN